MLGAVDLNDEPRICAKEIDFHSAAAVERNGQVGVELKSSPCLPQRFETSIEERLGSTSRAINAFGLRRNRTSGGHEQVRERHVNSVTNEPTHAGRVVPFPERISGQHHVRWPT